MTDAYVVNIHLIHYLQALFSEFNLKPLSFDNARWRRQDCGRGGAWQAHQARACNKVISVMNDREQSPNEVGSRGTAVLKLNSNVNGA
jgi:hypothetical protein